MSDAAKPAPEPPGSGAGGGNHGITDCHDVVLRLFEFVDHETGPLDQERIQAHLDECGSCLAEYERDLLVKALVRRACACQQAPQTLRTQILTRISATVTVTRNRPQQD